MANVIRPGGISADPSMGCCDRRWCPNTDGLAYRCRHDNDRLAYMTWSPVPTLLHPGFSVESAIAVTDPDALTEVRRVAQAHNAAAAR